MPHISEAFQERHFFVLLVCAFTFGVWYGLFGDGADLPNISGFLVYSLGFLTLAALLLLLLRLRFPKRLPGREIFTVMLVLAGFSGGILRVLVYDRVQYADLKALAGQTVKLTGVVTEEPLASSTGKSDFFPVRVFTAQTDEQTFPVRGTVQVYVRRSDPFVTFRGDTVTFRAALRTPQGEPFAGGYSLRHALYRENRCFSVMSGQISRAEEPIRIRSPFYRLSGLGMKLQKSVLSSVDRALGEFPNEAALLKGILLGQKDGFTPEQYQAFSQSGLIHISSASGMHVMFLMSFIGFLLRRLRIRRWLAGAVEAAVLVLFTAAAAFTPSVCRAALMFGFTRLSSLFGREPDPIGAAAAAALLLLLVNPYALTGYSFLLSFGAVLGILCLSDPLARLLNRPAARIKSPYLSRPAQAAGDALSVSLASNVGIGYFSARFFNRVSWGGIAANIPIVLLASAAFIGGLLVWAVGLAAPALSVLLAKPLWLCLRSINLIAAFAARRVFWFTVPTPPRSAFPVYLLCVWVVWGCVRESKGAVALRQ